jgi:hypothetical protein
MWSQSLIQCCDVIVDFHFLFFSWCVKGYANPNNLYTKCMQILHEGGVWQTRKILLYIFAPSLSNLYNTLVRHGFVAKLNSPVSLIPASNRNIEGVGIWYDKVEGSLSRHILYLELKLLHSKLLKRDHYIWSFLRGVRFDVHVRTYISIYLFIYLYIF